MKPEVTKAKQPGHVNTGEWPCLLCTYLSHLFKCRFSFLSFFFFLNELIEMFVFIRVNLTDVNNKSYIS